MDLCRDGFLKFRIMFTQNINEPPAHLRNSEEKYTKLYYQFVKHAFGLRYSNPGRANRIDISIFLDRVPITPPDFEKFRTHMSGLSNYQFFKSERVSIRKEDVTDVDSARHIILQAVDVILGAIQFRLNNKNLDKLPGKHRRGKRTRAKERVYKHLLKRIQELYPSFNIGITTGQIDGPQVRWTHPY